jgi:hypothetical protein
MKEDMVSNGNDFWIEDENGDRIFKFNGKAMRVRETLVIEDRQGNTLCKSMSTFPAPRCRSSPNRIHLTGPIRSPPS